MRYFEIPPLKIPAIPRKLFRVREGFLFPEGGLKDPKAPPGPSAQRGLPGSGRGSRSGPVFSRHAPKPRFLKTAPGFYPGFGRPARIGHVSEL